jgi:hypothetical protein
MTQSQNTTPATPQQSEAQPIDADVAGRRRERRYQRALAGWLASRMRAVSHQRRRDPGEQPARGPTIG